MNRLIVVVFLLLAGPLGANQLVTPSKDTLHCDPTVHVEKTFCPHCEAWTDFFSPDFTGKIPTEFHMTIFDKDGTEIFSTESIDKGWSGLAKEGDQQMSTFNWKMTYRYEKDGPLYECSGQLALIQ
jgi:hypothetical protein